MQLLPYRVTGFQGGPMQAGQAQTILQFAASFQALAMSTIQGVAQDKLVSDSAPPLNIPVLPNLFP